MVSPPRCLTKVGCPGLRLAMSMYVAPCNRLILHSRAQHLLLLRYPQGETTTGGGIAGDGPAYGGGDGERDRGSHLGRKRQPSPAHETRPPANPGAVKKGDADEWPLMTVALWVALWPCASASSTPLPHPSVYLHGHGNVLDWHGRRQDAMCACRYIHALTYEPVMASPLLSY